jgi:DNA primase
MLVARLLNISYKAAAEHLNANRVVTFSREKVESPTEIHLPDNFEKLTLPETVGNKRFWRYAKARRLTPELVEEYGVGFCRDGYFGGRLVIPFTWHGELVSFFARDITGTHLVKVLYPRGGKQSKYLFNLDRLQGKRRDVVVVEGVFDCLTLADRAIASSGKHLSQDQISLLVQSGFETVFLCWDADAKREIVETAARLSGLLDVRAVLLPYGDPNELGREAVLKALAAAETPNVYQRIAQWGKKQR